MSKEIAWRLKNATVPEDKCKHLFHGPHSWPLEGLPGNT